MIALMAMAMQMDHPPMPPTACTAAMAAAGTPVGWSSPVTTRNGVPIATGRAATLTLRPAATVAFAMPPAHPAPMGVAVAVAVPRAGRWRVSLDAPGWIDLVAVDGKAATSVAHAHGPACSGIAKTVDFDLPAGRHTLQLSGQAMTTVRVMVSAG